MLGDAPQPERFRVDPADLSFGYLAHILCWGLRDMQAALWEHPTISVAIQELNRFAYSTLGRRLIEAKDGTERSDTIEEVRRLIARHRACGPTEVDCLVFDDALKALQPDAAKPGRTNKKKTRLKRGEAALKIQAAYESLAGSGEWNADDSKIISMAGVPRSTYYNVLETDERTKDAKEEYHARRLGRGPARRAGF